MRISLGAILFALLMRHFQLLHLAWLHENFVVGELTSERSAVNKYMAQEDPEDAAFLKSFAGHRIVAAHPKLNLIP